MTMDGHFGIISHIVPCNMPRSPDRMHAHSIHHAVPATLRELVSIIRSLQRFEFYSEIFTLLGNAFTCTAKNAYSG